MISLEHFENKLFPTPRQTNFKSNFICDKYFNVSGLHEVSANFECNWKFRYYTFTRYFKDFLRPTLYQGKATERRNKAKTRIDTHVPMMALGDYFGFSVNQ